MSPMLRRLAFAGAWVGATALAVLIAAAAVASVRTGVTDQPRAAEPFTRTQVTVAAATTSTTVSGATTTTQPGGSTSTTTATTTTTPPGETTTTPPGETTTTQPGGSTLTTTTSTTVPGATTTTTEAPPTTTTSTIPPSETLTYSGTPGQVTIRSAEPDVWFVAAAANFPFMAEVKDTGPNEVSVEFESEDEEWRFQAKWEDGELEVKFEKKGEG